MQLCKQAEHRFCAAKAPSMKEPAVYNCCFSNYEKCKKAVDTGTGGRNKAEMKKGEECVKKKPITTKI